MSARDTSAPLADARYYCMLKRIELSLLKLLQHDTLGARRPVDEHLEYLIYNGRNPLLPLTSIESALV
jgi:hypothetical protein